MACPSPVLSAEQRSWHYWFDGGLPSLLTGIACLLLAASLIFPRHHKSSVFDAILTFATLNGLILLRQRQVLDWLKSKITYPRTGYLAPPYFTQDTTLPMDLTVLSLQANRLHADRKRRRWLAIALTLAAVLPMILLQTVAAIFRLHNRTNGLDESLFLPHVPVILGLIWWVFAELGELFHFVLSLVGLTYAARGLIRIILYLHGNRQS
jgi:hypothetical protein